MYSASTSRRSSMVSGWSSSCRTPVARSGCRRHDSLWDTRRGGPSGDCQTRRVGASLTSPTAAARCPGTRPASARPNRSRGSCELVATGLSRGPERKAQTNGTTRTQPLPPAAPGAFVGRVARSWVTVWLNGGGPGSCRALVAGSGGRWRASNAGGKGRMRPGSAVTTSSSRPGAMVRLESVRKSFGDNVVLDGIDLDVAAGEVLVVIGAERQRQEHAAPLHQPARAARLGPDLLRGPGDHGQATSTSRGSGSGSGWSSSSSTCSRT